MSLIVKVGLQALLDRATQIHNMRGLEYYQEAQGGFFAFCAGLNTPKDLEIMERWATYFKDQGVPFIVTKRKPRKNKPDTFDLWKALGYSGAADPHFREAVGSRQPDKIRRRPGRPRKVVQK